MIMKLDMEQYALKLYKGYINDDPELTLTHFKTISNFVKLDFVLTVVQMSGERLQDHWSSGSFGPLISLVIFRELHDTQVCTIISV